MGRDSVEPGPPSSRADASLNLKPAVGLSNDFTDGLEQGAPLLRCFHVSRGVKRCHVLMNTCHFANWTPVLLGFSYAPLQGPPGMPPAPALAATRRTATAQGGAERNLGSSHAMTPRPNGANGERTYPVPCAPSGHGGRCGVWFPGFHPGLSPVAPSGHGTDLWTRPEARLLRRRR